MKWGKQISHQQRQKTQRIHCFFSFFLLWMTNEWIDKATKAGQYIFWCCSKHRSDKSKSPESIYSKVPKWRIQLFRDAFQARTWIGLQTLHCHVNASIGELREKKVSTAHHITHFQSTRFCLIFGPTSITLAISHLHTWIMYIQTLLTSCNCTVPHSIFRFLFQIHFHSALHSIPVHPERNKFNIQTLSR